MAVLADIGRVDMGWVLARCVSAIVAAVAISRDIRVVENRRCPKGARVAIVALVAGSDMAGGLPGSLESVVAGTAAAIHGRVVHIVDWAPGRCCVTSIAERRRCDVIGRLH